MTRLIHLIILIEARKAWNEFSKSDDVVDGWHEPVGVQAPSVESRIFSIGTWIKRACLKDRQHLFLKNKPHSPNKHISKLHLHATSFRDVPSMFVLRRKQIENNYSKIFFKNLKVSFNYTTFNKTFNIKILRNLECIRRNEKKEKSSSPSSKDS